MSMIHDKSESAVAARLRSTLVQVDEYLGVSQGSSTSITGHNTSVHYRGRHRSYQVNRPLVVNLLLQASHSKPDTTLVIFSELLASVGDLIKVGGGEGEGAESGLAERGAGQPGAEYAGERHLRINI